MLEAAICLSVVAQNILKHLVQLTEIVISGSRFHYRKKRLTKFRRECRCLSGEPSSMAEHVTHMLAIRLLWRTVMGAVCQWFERGRVVAHKA